MFEFYFSLASLIILSVDGRLVDGLPFDGDVPVSTILPDDGDLGLAARLLYQMTAFLK